MTSTGLGVRCTITELLDRCKGICNIGLFLLLTCYLRLFVYIIITEIVEFTKKIADSQVFERKNNTMHCVT